jgi:hypothetical protein
MGLCMNLPDLPPGQKDGEDAGLLPTSKLRMI